MLEYVRIEDPWDVYLFGAYLFAIIADNSYIGSAQITILAGIAFTYLFVYPPAYTLFLPPALLCVIPIINQSKEHGRFRLFGWMQVLYMILIVLLVQRSTIMAWMVLFEPICTILFTIVNAVVIMTLGLFNPVDEQEKEDRKLVIIEQCTRYILKDLGIYIVFLVGSARISPTPLVNILLVIVISVIVSFTSKRLANLVESAIDYTHW